MKFLRFLITCLFYALLFIFQLPGKYFIQSTSYELETKSPPVFFFFFSLHYCFKIHFKGGMGVMLYCCTWYRFRNIVFVTKHL